MKFSLQATMVVAALCALACFAVALNGFFSLAQLTDPTLVSDARGYVGFWAFLGLVACAIAIASWWIVRHAAKAPPPAAEDSVPQP